MQTKEIEKMSNFKENGIDKFVSAIIFFNASKNSLISKEYL